MPTRLGVGVGVALIRAYQMTLGPLLFSGACRFEPSCSHYGLEAVRSHGLLRGSWLTARRLCRCQPWGGSGHDPVPPPAADESGSPEPRSARSFSPKAAAPPDAFGDESRDAPPNASPRLRAARPDGTGSADPLDGPMRHLIGPRPAVARPGPRG